MTSTTYPLRSARLAPHGSSRQTSRHRDRIRSKHFDLRCMRFEFGQRLLHRLVVDVSGEIDEKSVFPFGLVRRPRFDAVHADAMARKRAQYVEQRAGLILDENQDRCTVVSRRWKNLP